MNISASPKEYAKIRLDDLNGIEAYLEVNWSKYAFEEDLVKLKVKKDLDHFDNYDEVILRMEDLKTLLLAFAKENEDLRRFGTYKEKKMGIKYVPVKERVYREYLEMKKNKGRFNKTIY